MLDENVIAAGRMQRPEGNVAHGKIAECDVVGVLDINGRRARIKIACNVVLAYLLYKCKCIAVNNAISCDCHMVGILRINKSI